MPLKWQPLKFYDSDKEIQESSVTMCELKWFLKEKCGIYLVDY